MTKYWGEPFTRSTLTSHEEMGRREFSTQELGLDVNQTTSSGR